MQFENTYSLLWLLLLLPAGLLVGLTLRWKQQVRRKLGDHRLISDLLRQYAPGNFLWKASLLLLGIAMLVLALGNLRQPDQSEKTKLNGTDLMIALDVSNSMLARDVQPSRLDKAKLLIGKLIDQRQGNRIGMVVFAGNAYLQMPLTTDAAAAKLFLSTISPNLVPYQGTNISEALQLSNRSLNTQEKKYKSILLITDGEDHDNTPVETAEKLKQDGVVINTVGIGSPQGANILDPATNQPRRDEQGNLVVSKLNQDILQKIAAATSGSYLFLQDADAAANEIGRDLASMEQKPITDTTLTNFNSYYAWFVGAAMLLLLAEILLRETRKQPKKVKLATLIPLLLFSIPAFSQKEVAEQVRKGNEAYRKQDFATAAKDYEAALKASSNNNTAAFNLGNTRYKTGKYEEATRQYDALATSSNDKKLQAQSLYNKGLSQIRQQKLSEGIQSLKQSLRLNPQDEATRENLQKALNDKKQQDQQQQQQKQDQQNKDQQKDPPRQQPDKKKQPEQPDPGQNRQQQQPPPPKINKQEAEQKLQALRQEEKKLQKKLNERQASGTRQPEKDW